MGRKKHQLIAVQPRQRFKEALFQILAAPRSPASTVLLVETMHGLQQRQMCIRDRHCARWGPWGSKYLEEGFFEALARLHSDQLVLFSAHRGDPRDPVAMSMCVQDGRQLWGRYWLSLIHISEPTRPY